MKSSTWSRTHGAGAPESCRPAADTQPSRHHYYPTTPGGISRYPFSLLAVWSSVRAEAVAAASGFGLAAI